MNWQPDQGLMDNLAASWLAEKIVACLNHGEEAERETALCFVDRLCQALRYCLADAAIGPEVQRMLKENGDPAALESIVLTVTRDRDATILWYCHPAWNYAAEAFMQGGPCFELPNNPFGHLRAPACRKARLVLLPEDRRNG